MCSTGSGSQASHSSSASATTNLPQFHPIHMKLDRHNYAFWRAQVLPTIRTHGFEEYISPTGMPPPPFLPSASGVAPRPNPEYSSWIRKDQFLLSWFLASIGDSMLGHVIRCNTARDVWITLDRLFLSQSKARMMQLRMALQSTRKGAQSIEEYFLKMRSYADQLSAIGQVVSDDELQMYILAGFGVEYEALVVNFMQRSDTPTLQEMQLAFQAYELRLAQQLNHVDIIDPSANALFYGGGRGAFGRGSGRGASGSKVQSLKAVVCQLCGKIGHVALKCFRRFDVHFTGNSESETMPHQALMVESGCPENEEGSGTWYIDSGATNHVTNELSNLSISAEYQGNEAVMVGNGTSLPISSIGKTLITAPTSKSAPAHSTSLLLNNILYVPNIAKNLLSTSQFTHDNNVVFEFHHNCCLVKDKISQRTLLEGHLVNGLYQLDLSQIPLHAATLGSSWISTHNKDSSMNISALNSFVVHNSVQKCTTDTLNFPLALRTDDSSVRNVTAPLVDLATSNSNDINVLHKALGHPNNIVLSKICSTLNIPFKPQVELL